MYKVPFNVPYLPGGDKKVYRNADLLRTQGVHYENCKKVLQEKFGYKRTIITNSCTAALELAALTLNIKPGDEVIVPSYTYVATANAFALRGAKLKFVDVNKDFASVDFNQLEKLVSKKTKAIVVVHYAGMAYHYDKLALLKKKFKIPIIEDAAQALGSYYKGKPVGSIGDMVAFSFHETKNISCGQGGALVVNNTSYFKKANQISMGGTNKNDFIQGKVKSYSWQTLGSNFLLAEPLCAILYLGLNKIEAVNRKRKRLWKNYYEQLTPLQQGHKIKLPHGDENCEHNAHIFYIQTKNRKERDHFIAAMKRKGIETTFHYQPLHQSYFANENFNTKKLPNTEVVGNTLVRLPLYYDLTVSEQQRVIRNVQHYFGK